MLLYNIMQFVGLFSHCAIYSNITTKVVGDIYDVSLKKYKISQPFSGLTTLHSILFNNTT